jgi:parallel beta-helix repeat protein
LRLLSSKSKIENLTVKNSQSTNIIVNKRSRVSITNCSVEKAGKYGIEVQKSSATNKYQFILSNSTVSGSSSQGVYAFKRKITLSGNEIFDNSEEGFDLHEGMKGTISGNDIFGNGESGIESILAGSSLNIKSNEVKSNHTQGITVQIYSAKKKGKVKISGNTIKSNSKYGIRYANYTHSIGSKKFRKFADKYIKRSNNTSKDNGDGDIFYE